MPPRLLFWLDELPVELIPQIALHMDPWALKALLKASPRIRSQCVLIVGEPSKNGIKSNDLPHFFDDVDGLRCQRRLQFNPNVTRAMLKICEVNLFELDQLFYHQYPFTSSFQHCHPYDSYVLLLGSTKDEYLLQYRNANWTLGKKKLTYWQTHTQFMPAQMAINRATGNQIAHYQTITQLEIECVSDIHRLELPCLRSLRVVFTEPADGSRPRFSQISLPVLQTLEIFYGNSAPLVKDIQLPSKASCLTLCHIPSQRCDLSRPLPVYPSPIEDLDFSALCTSSFFRTITVVGGHDMIVKQLRLEKTVSFHWRQTCQQAMPVVTSLPPAPHLRALTFESLLPDAIVPSYKTWLEQLIVIGYDGLVFQDPTFESPLPDATVPSYKTWLEKLIVILYDRLVFQEPLVSPPNEQRVSTLLIHCHGERADRAIPSFASVRHLINERGCRELSLYNITVPPKGEDLEVDRLVEQLHDPWNVMHARLDLIRLPGPED